MGHGGRRLNAGRPKKRLQDHWIRGTYRADRHGELPKHVHVLPQTLDDWQPTPADLDALGDRGREFVSKLLASFKCTHSEGCLVLEGAHAVDALAALRALSMDGKTLAEINSIQRLEIAWSRQLAALLSQLRVSHATTTP